MHSKRKSPEITIEESNASSLKKVKDTLQEEEKSLNLPLDSTIFPYYPPQAMVTSLHSNGRCLTPEQIEQVSQSLESEKPGLFHFLEYSKTTQVFNDFPYKILKTTTGHLWCQDGFLGKGENGSTYLFSPLPSENKLEESSYKAVKFLPNTKSHETSSVRAEQTNLAVVGKSREAPIFFRDIPFDKTSPYKNRKAAIVMDYERGQDLEKLMTLRNTKNTPESLWPDLIWLDIAIKCVKAMIDSLEQGVLPCDIRLANIMFDIVSDKLSFIDLALSLRFEKVELNKLSIKFNAGIQGTLEYLAPEVRRRVLKKEDIHTYTEKTQVYALGVLLQEILFNQKCEAEYEKEDADETGIDDVEVQHIRRDPSAKQGPFDQFSEFADYIDELVVVKMQETKPKDRPTLEDVYSKLLAIRSFYTAHPVQLSTDEVSILSEAEQKIYTIRLASDSAQIQAEIEKAAIVSKQAVEAEKLRYESIVAGIKRQSLFAGVPQQSTAREISETVGITQKIANSKK